MPFRSHVPWEPFFSSSNIEYRPLFRYGIDLNNYIRYFLKEDTEGLSRPTDVIWQMYRHRSEKLLVVRLNELCYESLMNLNEKDSIDHMMNDINACMYYFEDVVLSLALYAYLVYVYEGEVGESDIPYDLTTLHG